MAKGTDTFTPEEEATLARIEERLDTIERRQQAIASALLTLGTSSNPSTRNSSEGPTTMPKPNVTPEEEAVERATEAADT